MNENETMKYIEELYKNVKELSKEVKALRTENENLKDEISGLHASIAISKGDWRLTEGAKNIVNQKNRKFEDDAVLHFNNMAIFGNTWIETENINKQR